MDIISEEDSPRKGKGKGKAKGKGGKGKKKGKGVKIADSHDEGGAGGVRFSQPDIMEFADPYDESQQAADPNQFDNLCDGVLGTLALVHESLQEFLDFKDELLLHQLPPNVLLKLSLLSGKLYRSISDLHMPSNELIRMVRVYSTPWEEKSAALQKLHEDYETKVAQLNVALRQLTLQETEAKRVARERRIMNWERLFAKVQTTKGHGRRWKFRMFDFKQKAAMGIEHLREYFHVGDDSEEEEEEEDIPPMQAIEEATPTDEVRDSEKPTEDEEEEDEINVDSMSEVEPGLAVEEFEAESPEPPVETADAGVWTEEPECDHFLHVRVFKPQGLKMAADGIKCIITYGAKIYKTGLLDAPSPEEEEEAAKKEAEEAAKKEAEAEAEKKKGKRLIGSRVKKVTIEEPEKSTEQIRKEQEARKKMEMTRYEEFEIPIPENVLGGVTQDPLYDSLQVSILVGGKAEELFATGTVDMDDLHSLDAPVRLLPSYRGDCVTPPPPFDPKSDKELAALEPIPFPIFPVTGGRGLPAGTIPLACFWSRKEKHRRFNRQSETVHIYEVVEDLTGIDLNQITKEELMREKVEVGVSPRPETPKPVIETVLKEEYDQMVRDNEEQLLKLQKEYEDRLQEMADSLTAAMPIPPDSLDQATSPAFSLRPTSGELREAARVYGFRPRSESSRSVGSPPRETPDFGPNDQRIESQPCVHPSPAQQDESLRYDTEMKRKPRKRPAILEDPRKARRGGPPVRVSQPLPKWGENLPDDFFERLDLFSNAALRHREELSDRIKTEIATELERRLAESYKLSGKIEEEDIHRALKDVCLPAVFMPTRTQSGNIFNPRARQYFHPTGQLGLRLTQPPSMLHLPPIKNRVSVMNLFDAGQQLHARTGLDWFSERAMAVMGGAGGDPISGLHNNTMSTLANAHPPITEEEPANGRH